MNALTVIEHPAVGRQRFRRKLERVIDKLIVTLDTLDGDPDLEDGGDDEPSLSASLPVMAWHGSQDAWLQGSNDDRESDDADSEPSLGSTEGQADQTRWASGGNADLEWQCEDEGGEHDGREPEDGT